AIPSLRARRDGGRRQAAVRGEQDSRQRNLELSHHRGSDSLHDGAPQPRSFVGAASTRPAARSASAAEARGEGGRRASAAGQEGRQAVQSGEAGQAGAGSKEEMTGAPAVLRFARDRRGYENFYLVQPF